MKSVFISINDLAGINYIININQIIYYSPTGSDGSVLLLEGGIKVQTKTTSGHITELIAIAKN
ncbi:MAG: hypothetical protein QM731_02935 [Chitinophagaceae bacterium]